jgi:hypothetical protein
MKLLVTMTTDGMSGDDGFGEAINEPRFFHAKKQTFMALLLPIMQ